MTSATIPQTVGRPAISRLPRIARTTALAILALLVVGLSLCAMVFVPPSVASVIDNGQQIIATLLAMLVILLVYRSGDVERHSAARGLLLALAFDGVAMLAWDVVPGSLTTAARPVAGLFIIAMAILFVTLARIFFRGLEHELLVPVILDGLIMIVAIITAFATIWEFALGPSWRDSDARIALIGAIVVSAAPAAGYLVLLHRRVQPSFRGAYAVLMGMTLLGIAWIIWLALPYDVEVAPVVSLPDFAYSVGVVLLAYGISTWDVSPTANPRFNRFAGIGVAVFPLLAVGLCVPLSLLAPASSDLDIVRIGAAVVVGLTLTRQAFMAHREGRSRIAERKATVRLTREIIERTQVLGTLSHLEVTESPEVAAWCICEEALRLDGINNAVVLVFQSAGGASVLAVSGVSDLPGGIKATVPAERAAYLASRAAQGPWSELYSPSADPHLAMLYARGLRTSANVPLRWNDQVVGMISLGSASLSAMAYDERLSTVREFGLVASSVLGPALAERTRLEGVRMIIQATIDNKAFHPVFQPVVALASGVTIGFEALTRFDDGQRPDLCFLDAAQAGLGLELEAACLRAALRAAVALPEQAWLSLNASPDLAIARAPLIAILAGTEREIVLEITEHVPIASYADLMGSLQGLRGRVRLAVDDAGSGYAGLQHLLEIQPDIMKLDIALVRSVDVDPGRRALIASMIAFAHETGCTVLAEGVETQAELDTLRALGVTLGQGYLLGRPAVATHFAHAPAAQINEPARGYSRAEASC
jgi:EAL domain-containing protein (putative c-di-GMP-specific phosphodiesterase class I)